MTGASTEPVLLARDGHSWRAGGSADADWIARGTTIDRTITSGIPPVFAAYATIVVPADRAAQAEQDLIILSLLRDGTTPQRWWLGYLDTGSDDIVFPGAPQVTLPPGWPYVLVEAGPDQPAQWRGPGEWSPRGGLPELMFPQDRSWLMNTLWDDDWRCLGGPAGLIDRFAGEGRLEVARVQLGQDATPAGHTAF